MHKFVVFVPYCQEDSLVSLVQCLWETSNCLLGFVWPEPFKCINLTERPAKPGQLVPTVNKRSGVYLHPLCADSECILNLC